MISKTFTRSGRTYHLLDDGTTMGPKMDAGVKALGRTDYKSMNALAKSVGPHGSQNYGYQIINRLKRAGMITVDPDHPDATPSGQGAVVLTGKGEAYLEALQNE